jgi:hypothetical protein
MGSCRPCETRDELIQMQDADGAGHDKAGPGNRSSYTMLLPDEGKKVDNQSPLISGIGNDKDTFRLVEAFKIIEDVTTRRKLLGLVQAIGGMDAED